MCLSTTTLTTTTATTMTTTTTTIIITTTSLIGSQPGERTSLAIEAAPVARESKDIERIDRESSVEYDYTFPNTMCSVETEKLSSLADAIGSAQSRNTQHDMRPPQSTGQSEHNVGELAKIASIREAPAHVSKEEKEKFQGHSSRENEVIDGSEAESGPVGNGSDKQNDCLTTCNPDLDIDLCEQWQIEQDNKSLVLISAGNTDSGESDNSEFPSTITIVDANDHRKLLAEAGLFLDDPSGSSDLEIRETLENNPGHSYEPRTDPNSEKQTKREPGECQSIILNGSATDDRTNGPPTDSVADEVKEKFEESSNRDCSVEAPLTSGPDSNLNGLTGK